ncbi:MAG: sigma 54-interacting transcriptional regulator [Sediminicola sp.]|tara:strand:+ start:42292 stop:44409 length:2118 start_codon:yes stop_codon:yes gene_type:complete
MEQNSWETPIKDWWVEYLPYEVMWMDQQGRIVYANEQFCERMGYGKSEIVSLRIFDINSTATPESWAVHWETVAKEGVQSFRATHKTKKGQFYEVGVYAQFFSNKGKKLICAIVSDITRTSFYQNLMDSSTKIATLGGWELNLQDGSLMVTAETLAIFGTLEKEDLLPGNVIRYFKEPEKMKSLLSGAIRKVTPFDEVLETVHMPKKYIRAVAKPVLKGDKVYKVTGVYQDITDQQGRENDLKLYKEVIDNAEDLIFLYDGDGQLVHYSDSVPKKLGHSKNQLKSATVYDLDPAVTQEWWHTHFREILQKGSLRFEWMMARKDGTKFPVDITANHLCYEGKDLNCAVVRDITDRKMRDLKLFEALEEIKSLQVRLENENEYLQGEINKALNYDKIIYKSTAYEKVLRQVDLVAPTETTVLITGESGTGKELLASALHANSKRKDRPLIKINCATLPKALIESELFGHRRGAFTGAVEHKLGKFALADGGTLFLDEIGELPLELQPKLLRVLQESEFDELGGTKPIKVDVRIIAATNRDLRKMVEEGSFREDLFYRLNVFPLYNIPLRARKEDIPLLAQYFLEKYSLKAGKAFKRLSKKMVEAFMEYSFPGNIRELENLIERAVILENGHTLSPGSWMPTMEKRPQLGDFPSFEVMQREYIIKVLQHTQWRVSGPQGAAKILKMKDKTLFGKMKRLGIEKQVILKK